jgi:RimJ/RimL family protein N-acetyltransferase
VEPERLVTERLTLDPLRVEDAEELAPLLDDPALHAFTGGAPATRDELRDRFRRQVRGRSPDGRERWLNWVARRRDSGAAVGMLQATVGPRRAGVAWVIAVPHQRQGYAREAAVEMARWLEAHGAGTLVAHVAPEHAASEAVARAIGLRPTPERHEGEVRWESARPADTAKT